VLIRHVSCGDPMLGNAESFMWVYLVVSAKAKPHIQSFVRSFKRIYAGQSRSKWWSAHREGESMYSETLSVYNYKQITLNETHQLEVLFILH
jgi:hypothetical protein